MADTDRTQPPASPRRRSISPPYFPRRRSITAVCRSYLRLNSGVSNRSLRRCTGKPSLFRRSNASTIGSWQMFCQLSTAVSSRIRSRRARNACRRLENSADGDSRSTPSSRKTSGTDGPQTRDAHRAETSTNREAGQSACRGPVDPTQCAERARCRPQRKTRGRGAVPRSPPPTVEQRPAPPPARTPETRPGPTAPAVARPRTTSEGHAGCKPTRHRAGRARSPPDDRPPSQASRRSTQEKPHAPTRSPPHRDTTGSSRYEDSRKEGRHRSTGGRTKARFPTRGALRVSTCGRSPGLTQACRPAPTTPGASRRR